MFEMFNKDKKDIAKKEKKPKGSKDSNSGSDLESLTSSMSSLTLKEKEAFKGAVLDDLELLATVGTGTFGRVRVVKYPKTDKYYALKMVKKSEVVRLQQVEHLHSEKSILTKLDHPFIVKLYYHFQDYTHLHMVLEYVPGGEFFSHLRRARRLSNDVSKFYAAEIVSAFGYLHKLSIVYRDLKPENLLLDSEGHIKITDFGFAKSIEYDRTYTLCGTPEYLAPEIIQSRGHGKAVDWWTLGILIFEMLHGYPPFFDNDPFHIYEKILAGRIEFSKHLDAYAKDIIKKLLQHDLTKRLGNLKNGAEDVRNHHWFSSIDFKALEERKINGPIIPAVKGAGDTSNFDRYPESKEKVRPQKGPDPYHDLFKDF